jgi:NaMN:DMB phosphoribosyltransferase
LRGWEGEGGVEWVVREGVGAGGEMNQALYAHMKNKRKKKKIPIKIPILS